jgi:hypothetical protein
VRPAAATASPAGDEPAAEAAEAAEVAEAAEEDQ